MRVCSHGYARIYTGIVLLLFSVLGGNAGIQILQPASREFVPFGESVTVRYQVQSVDPFASLLFSGEALWTGAIDQGPSVSVAVLPFPFADAYFLHRRLVGSRGLARRQPGDSDFERATHEA